MGLVPEITHDQFPDQGRFYGKRVRVCFHYDRSHSVMGDIVRHDAGEPGRIIIKLDDGRYVLSTECQYQPVD